ncbi:hypothetical protein PKNOH_S03315600 [Plasmodium knowlesi]|uniref:Uncharacterized protein n=1 Tax=Plasmodium knowlesi TaxID=5850 RepID=A0A1Y3DVX7_PLAKN|nr:hypothetical protein PKNOH_S03315600 [Plasmodium knowlesi]
MDVSEVGMKDIVEGETSHGEPSFFMDTQEEMNAICNGKVHQVKLSNNMWKNHLEEKMRSHELKEGNIPLGPDQEAGKGVDMTP